MEFCTIMDYYIGLTANIQTNYIETKVLFIKFDSFCINYLLHNI